MARIIQIAFTIFVAILFGPALSAVLGLFTTEGTLEFIFRQFSGDGIFSPGSIVAYLEIAFWAAVFWFIARPLFAFPLGAIMPFVGLRSETRLMRVAQFLSFELALFFLPAMLIALFFLLVVSSDTMTSTQRVLAVRYIFTEVNWFSWWGLIMLIAVNASVLKRSHLYVKLVEFLETGRFGRGGSGRFAGMFEEYASRWTRDGYSLFFGNSLFMPWLRVGSTNDRHMLTFAASRGGKGTGCIIPNLLQWQGSALVVDPKGTNAAVTARRRRDMGQNVHILDPFGVVEGQDKAGFNPLDFIDPDSLTIVEDIGRIAEALVIPEPGGRNRHFTDSARDLVAGYIAQIVTDPDETDRSLYTLRRYLSLAGDERDDLHARMMMNEKAGFLARIAAQRILSGGTGNELAGIISTALTQTAWLSSAAMRDVLTTSSFDFADMKDAATTIYVVIPPEHLEFHKRYVRLVINLALAAFSKGGRAALPGLFIIDEAAALGRMDEIAKAYGLLGGYNMVVWSFFQDKGQLDRLYGEDANSFIANSRAVQVFSVVDRTTQDFVVEKLGTSSINSPSALRGGTEVMPLRTIGDVEKEISFEDKKLYVLRSGKAPMILERVEYFKAPSWSGLAASDPDYPDGLEPDFLAVLHQLPYAWTAYIAPALSKAWDEKSFAPLVDLSNDGASSEPESVETAIGLILIALIVIAGLLAIVLAVIALVLAFRFLPPVLLIILILGAIAGIAKKSNRDSLRKTIKSYFFVSEEKDNDEITESALKGHWTQRVKEMKSDKDN